MQWSHLLLMEIFRNEEIFCKESAEPRESMQFVQLHFLEEIWHAGEAADTKHTQRHVIACHSRTKVHL